MMFKTTKPATFSLAAATLLGALALAAPLNPAAAQAQPAPAPAATTAPAPHAHHHAARTPEEGVEAHIANFKAKLKITDAQSAQWEAVASVMRDNAKEAQARMAAHDPAAAM